MVSESKIKIKMGLVEIEYEGSSSFLKEELIDLVESVSRLYQENKSSLEPGGGYGEDSIQSGSGNVGVIKGSSNEIAKKMSVKNGTDLIFACCVKLLFVNGVDTFNYNEIRNEMVSATNYVNAIMKKNFAANLKSLVKQDKISELGSKKYSIPAKEQEKVKSIIVQ